ncbi:MAG: 4-alpha-glucanotransferase [Mediterranea sp.]|jgi:4-alpha-glucanotransferase|nr:4-alpha-glucanotransferase [Mediterranea sp.]
MVISFRIEYRTNWGEEVRIAGLAEGSLPMHTTDGIYWTAEWEANVPREGQQLSYRYQIEQDGVVVRKEWDCFPRTLFVVGPSAKQYRVEDSWKMIPGHAYLYSSAFTEALLAHPKRDRWPQAYRRSIVIKAYAPHIGPEYGLAVCGNQQALGQWNTAEAVPMSDAGFPEWQVELDASKLMFPLEYKFILYRKEDHSLVGWEMNPNRCLADPKLEPNETLVVADRYAYFDIPSWRGAGVAIPVFSLRTEGSFGVGDFGDLRRLVDWAARTGLKMIQILPVNDTTMTHTWTDSYPYNSISIYAFHPMYADLRQMGHLRDRKAQARFDRRQRELNALPTLDYEAVNESKRELFGLLYRQEGEALLATEGFRDFFEANREWLRPYAAFCYLRDAYGTPDFRQWPAYSTYRPEEIEALCTPGNEGYPHIALAYFIQYHLHLQLQAVRQYARQHGVALKGDIPIGISRNSVEAWTEPHYFNLDGQAGAPPDDFSVNGQNWGFPTYNWEVMAQDGYRWWMRRFRKMAEYFDAYRIDHILGFFRIWEIPLDAVHGLLGHFVPALPMSREEMAGYGFTFREEFLRPFIHNSFLSQLFGPHTAEVKRRFLVPTTPGSYRLKEGFGTQREVERYFAGHDDADSRWIRDGLYTLISNVLFVADPREADRYHPRIGVQHDYVFRSLGQAEQEAFNRLYDHYFYHRHNDFWYCQAMQKLPRLTQSTRMLVCGEDLGMIPACVPQVMSELRILSLEIQRMPKLYGQEFGRPAEYPYPSVSTISTHDMSTLRGWWEENLQQTQRYYNTVLGHYGTAPATATPELCEEVLRQHLAGSSILCIPSWQDWLSIDGRLRNPDVEAERINVPANPRNYWRYRMHLTLEQLLAEEELNEKIARLARRE